jgi:adenine phosphoribosyltransferase
MDDRLQRLEQRIRNVPDFPKPGILFKDITPLIADAASFRTVIDLFTERYRASTPELVVGIESRGFIFASALADRLGAGLIVVRKPGKLPYHTDRVTYQLEYGQDSLEMHKDAVRSGQRVLIVDDLLATGGTAGAAARLVEGQGGVVQEHAFVIELGFLKGRDKLSPQPVHSLLKY